MAVKAVVPKRDMRVMFKIESTQTVGYMPILTNGYSLDSLFSMLHLQAFLLSSLTVC